MQVTRILSHFEVSILPEDSASFDPLPQAAPRPGYT